MLMRKISAETKFFLMMKTPKEKRKKDSHERIFELNIYTNFTVFFQVFFIIVIFAL